MNVGATSSADQRAEPGGVDEGNLVEVDDDGAAGVRQREQPATQSGHGSDVDLSGHGDDRGPPGSRRTRMASVPLLIACHRPLPVRLLRRRTGLCLAPDHRPRVTCLLA
jgi:hypothetical protein